MAQKDGLVGKGAFLQAEEPKYHPQNSHGRRELKTESYPLTTTHMSWHTCVNVYAHVVAVIVSTTEDVIQKDRYLLSHSSEL